MPNLERFVKAQKRDYAIALKEIQSGHKESHWMWYIFPQLQGLGSSEIALYFSIRNEEEAMEYLQHEILRARLLEISSALLELKSNDATFILGYPDDLKLKSCMTLFYTVEKNPIFKAVLEKFYSGELDDLTLRLLKRNKFTNLE